MLKQQLVDNEVVKWTILEAKQVKKVLLGEKGSSKYIYIGANSQLEERYKLHTLLKEFKDVFAWKYTNLKGIPKHIGLSHKIILEPKSCLYNPSTIG